MDAPIGTTATLDGPDVTVVVAPDEIDLYNVADFRRCLAATDPTSAVRVDFTSVKFCGSIGLRALIGAYKQALAAGGEFRVANPPAHVRKVLELCGLELLIAES